MYNLSLYIVIAGSLLFLTAAFWPTSRVFGERSAEKKLEIIMESKTSWDVMQVLFGTGALIAAIGIGFLGYALQFMPKSNFLKISSILLLAGCIFWIWHLYLRAVDPVSFATSAQPWWHFALYTILTQLAMAIVGYFLWHSPFPNWIGMMFIIGMASLFILTVLFKDMPPFVYYIFFIIASIALLNKSSLSVPAIN